MTQPRGLEICPCKKHDSCKKHDYRMEDLLEAQAGVSDLYKLMRIQQNMQNDYFDWNCPDCQLNRVEQWAFIAEDHYDVGEWAEARTAAQIGQLQLEVWRARNS